MDITIEQALDQFEDLTLKLLLFDNMIPGRKFTMVSSTMIASAVSMSFMWKTTPQGDVFWRYVFHSCFKNAHKKVTYESIKLSCLNHKNTTSFTDNL